MSGFAEGLIAAAARLGAGLREAMKESRADVLVTGQDGAERAPSRPETCGTCLYARVTDGSFPRVYQCVAMPPQVMLRPDGQGSSMFPPVKLEWHCGCWCPKSPGAKP